MHSKKELRKIAIDIRNSLDNEIISSRIVNNILSWDVFLQAKNVMIFYPINSEVNLLSLLTKQDKNFYFPKIISNDIIPLCYDKRLGFTKGKFNILEPQGCVLEDYSKLDLILLPAVAVSCLGYRLGYGKGFYDKFLKMLDKSNTISCVPIAKSLIFNDLPIESHDEKFDYLITEDEIITSGNLDVLNP